MLKKDTLQLSRKTATVVLTVVGLGGVVLGLWKLRNLLMLVFAAYLLMLALQKPVRWIVKFTHLPIPAAVMFAYVLFLCFIIALLTIIAPSFAQQLQSLSTWIYGYEPLKELSQFSFTFAQVGELFSRWSTSFNTIINFIFSTFSTLLNAILFFVISVHFSLEHHDFYKKIYWLTNDERKVMRVQKFFLILERKLGGWVVGEMVLMLLIGVITFAGLFLLGVPFALPLGVLAGLLEIVPNVGPIIAAVPAVVLAFFIPEGGWVLGGMTLFFTFIIQQLENMFLVPMVMKKAANVDPLISILLVVVGAELMGVWGALLAIPLYIILRTTYDYWFKKAIVETGDLN